MECETPFTLAFTTTIGNLSPIFLPAIEKSLPFSFRVFSSRTSPSKSLFHEKLIERVNIIYEDANIVIIIQYDPNLSAQYSDQCLYLLQANTHWQDDWKDQGK